LRVKEAGVLCLAAGLNRVLVEHEQATAKLYRNSRIRLELARTLRAGIDTNTGVGAISSQAELATNLRCTAETVERYLRDMSSAGLLVKSSGREIGLHGSGGASYVLALPGDSVRAMAEATQEPQPIPKNDNVTNLLNPDANNATNLHNPDSRPDCYQLSHSPLIEGGLSLINPVHPDDVCLKISERISKALKANSDHGVSLDNLIRDIDALTDAFAKLFEHAQGDLDALNISMIAAVKGCVDLQAYRVRRTKNGERALEVDLPDVGALPPAQFVSDLIRKLHREKLTRRPFGSSINEASARLGRRIFPKTTKRGLPV
jgi:hypothetical protein